MLLNNRDTTDAMMFVAGPDNQYDGNKDFASTTTYTFDITKNRLNLTVTRRLQSLYIGFTNNMVFEYLLMVKMHRQLLSTYPDLVIGTYTIFSNVIQMFQNQRGRFLDILDDVKWNSGTTIQILQKISQDILMKYVYSHGFGN